MRFLNFFIYGLSKNSNILLSNFFVDERLYDLEGDEHPIVLTDFN